jgi:hypothetical protein
MPECDDSDSRSESKTLILGMASARGPDQFYRISNFARTVPFRP